MPERSRRLSVLAAGPFDLWTLRLVSTRAGARHELSERGHDQSCCLGWLGQLSESVLRSSFRHRLAEHVGLYRLCAALWLSRSAPPCPGNQRDAPRSRTVAPGFL